MKRLDPEYEWTLDTYFYMTIANLLLSIANGLSKKPKKDPGYIKPPKARIPIAKQEKKMSVNQIKNIYSMLRNDNYEKGEA